MAEPTNVSTGTTAPEGTATTKKLRYSDPDLKVTVKSVDDNGNPIEKKYDMYATVLARQSGFVDTCLSNAMREQQTREINFQDISPDFFEMALKFLDDPAEVVNMTVNDAIELVEFYDIYQFSGGLHLCDKVLAKEIKQLGSSVRSETDLKDLDRLVDYMAMADKFHLKDSIDEASSFLTMDFRVFKLLKSTSAGLSGSLKPFQLFSIEQAKKLHGLLIKNREQLPFEVTKEEVESSLFPKYFVDRVSLLTATEKLPIIEVQGVETPRSANSRYVYDDGDFVTDICKSDDLPYRCILTKKSYHQNWQLVWLVFRDAAATELQNRIVLWTCRHSKGAHLPPTNEDSWYPMDILERGGNVLKIVYHNKELLPNDEEYDDYIPVEVAEGFAE